jgi:hypothetical protein
MNSPHSKPFGKGRSWLCCALVTVFACGTAWATTKSITIDGLPAAAKLGVQYKVTFTAVDDKKNTDKTYVATAALTTTPATTPSATIQPPTVTFVAGVATAQVTFMVAGTQTLTIQDQAAGGLSASATSTVATATTSALAGCPTCFASLGVGTLVAGKYPDYNVSSNILQATHVGISTPSYSVGVAYKIPLRGFYGYKQLTCSPDNLTTSGTEGQDAFCYPFKAFVSLKFTPDASQAFNGFTFGLSHALHKYLDLMVGLSYSAHNEISPGFQQAAVSVLRTQQASGNPYYSQFNLAALQANTSQTAFDGFPTQLLNANGTTGALIYNGNITISHYRPGFFMGISLPISFKSAASGS